MSNFNFGISKWAIFRDKEACAKARKIKREEITKHSNPDFKIQIINKSDLKFKRVWDIFSRIKKYSEEGKKLVLILPQIDPMLIDVAFLLNQFKVDCRKLYTFNMDEWAGEDGSIAPETYPGGFLYAMKHNFYNNLDKDIRPPESQIIGPTDKNFKDYGKMIADLGGADVCYGGIGWYGHPAFIEPGTPEFAGNLENFEEWKKIGPKIVDLNPFTIMLCALELFGRSCDWSNVPPKAATIGPAEYIQAKLRVSYNYFTTANSYISCQRFAIRLAAHGPVTPLVPSSVIQTLPTELYLSDEIAADIEPSVGDIEWI